MTRARTMRLLSTIQSAISPTRHGRRKLRRAGPARIAVFCTVAAIVFSIAAAEAAPKQTTPKLTLYKTAQSAACDGDVAVWVDPEAGVYFPSRVATTRKSGGFACKKQAESAGYRPAKAR